MSNQGPPRRGTQKPCRPGPPAHRGSEPPMGPPSRPQVGGYTMAGVLAPRDALSPSRMNYARDAFSPTRMNYARDAFSPTRNIFRDQSIPYDDHVDPKGYRARSYASPPPQRLQQYQKGDPADFSNRMTQPKGEANLEGTAPTGLTRQIDKFLKKSDHTLDRWQAVLNSRVTAPGSPDNSQGPNTPMAAEIAAKAKRHLELLSRVTAAKKAAPIAECEEESSSSSLESLDGFDTDDDVGTTNAFDLSDDTSAEISKLDDLSSDSDDEYFDVLAFNRPGNAVNTSKTSGTKQPTQKQPEQPSRLPLTHSQSLPAVKKVPRSTKMGNLMGTASPAEATTASPQIPVTVNGIDSTPKQSPYVKRHTAPLPMLGKPQIPVTVNEIICEEQNQQQIKQPTPESPRKQLVPQPPLSEEVPRTPGSTKKYRAPQPPGSNLSINTLDGSTQNVSGSNKNLSDERLSRDRRKTQRIPSFKKGRAPQPPGSNHGSTQSLQNIQNEGLSTPVGAHLQQPVEQNSVSQAQNAALVNNTSETIPNSPPHPPLANEIDSSQQKIENGINNKKDKAIVAAPQNIMSTTDATKNIQNMTEDTKEKSITDVSSKPVQPAGLKLSASWVHLGPGKNEVTDSNTAKENTDKNDDPENIPVGRTKVNSDVLLNGPVPTSPPALDNVQGTQESVKSKPAHNADQGEIREKKNENNIEKTVNDSVKVTKDNTTEKTKEIVIDKTESSIKTEHVDKDDKVGKSDAKSDIEIVSGKEKSCDVKPKSETSENKKDESNSVPPLNVTGNESKNEENKESKPIANGHIPNGHIPREEDNTDKDSKPKKEVGKSSNKLLKFDSKDKVNELSVDDIASRTNSPFSRVNSRASSVSTNRSRTCSPSGPNRGISSKLASICKMLEDDVSEKSDRSKSRSVSRSSSGLGIKPGKIDGIANMFEKDKMRDKPPPEKDPNSIVGKLLKENPCSSPFNPEPRPPETKPKNRIGGLDISKFGEVTKPSRSLLAAKKAEVLKRTEELKKKNVALKTGNNKETGGKISDIASKFGKKEEMGNKISGIASRFGKKEETKPNDTGKVEEKKDKDNKADESKNGVDNKHEKEKEKVEDHKVDKGKIDVVDKNVSLDRTNDKDIKNENDKVGDGKIDKDKEVEENKTKDSNKGEKVEDKNGIKLEKKSIDKDKDNKKVDNLVTDKESNKVDKGEVTEIKGSGNNDHEDKNNVNDTQAGVKEQNSEGKGNEKENGTSKNSKDITSPNLDIKDSKNITGSENKEIPTDKSTKTVTPVADSVGGEQPVILEEGKSLSDGGEVKEKKRLKKKKKQPEDSTLLSTESLEERGNSSSSESTTLQENVPSKEKLPVDDNVSPGKEKTPGQVETERSMEGANIEKSLENVKKAEGAKHKKIDIDNISGNIEKLPLEDDKDKKEIKLNEVDKIDEGKLKEKSKTRTEKDITETSIQQKDFVASQKIEVKKDKKEDQVKVEALNEKDDITAALEKKIQEANSLIDEANSSFANKENVETSSNRKLSLQRSASTLDPIVEENALSLDGAKPENLPSIDHMDKAAVRHLQCLEQKRLTKLSNELSKVRETLKPVVKRNGPEEDATQSDVLDNSTLALEVVSPVAGIVNGKLTARIRPLHELESEVDLLIKDANKLIDPCLMVTPEEELFKRTVSPPPATIVKDDNGEIEIYHDAPDTLKLEDRYDMSKMDTLCELPEYNGIMSPRDRRARSVTSWGKYENGITSPHDRRARSITPWSDNDPSGYVSPRERRAQSITPWSDKDPSGYVSPRDRRARSIALGDNDSKNGFINPRDRRARSMTPWEGDEENENSRYARGSTPMRIAQTDSILSETDRLLRRSRSKNSLRRSYSRQMATECDLHLSEITADLTEEHSTATLAGERLEAEQAERMKLEKEVTILQDDVKRIERERNNIELESLHRRTDMLLNSEVNGDLDDDEMDYSLYKRKYEWCLKEIDVLKKQLKTQQEDDLDQLLLLKKQLEKKVGDANEEADEQRQVVAQMKKKSQRLTAEMNDLKILLEEQSSRNNLLEKKQRKFDQDVHIIQEELRHERMSKDKIQREKDSTLSEKFSFEQEVSTLKLELELKEEKVSALNRELDDLNSSGKVEEEVSTLKRAKHELELRIKDQEEELDDLAGQVQMLEGAKVRLEMSIEQMRKENRKEIQNREEELDEVRMGAQKKIKALEQQIENEHEERTLLVRERHELERRIADLQERTITSIDEDYVHKIKKELKKTKVLLKDTQTMLDKAQSEGSSKLLVRQLKTQLEDAEFAKTAAIKARQSAEADLQELQASLDEAQRLKKDAEERTGRLIKDKSELQTQLDESEEEVAEVMKKYKATVSQLSVDQISLSEQSQLISELEHEKQMMHDRLNEMTSKVEVLEGETANIHTQRRLEMKIKEMESKLELELTTRQRLESQIGRLKDQMERLGGECESSKLKESQSIDHSKKLGRQLREAKEDLSTLQQRYTDVSNKKQETEKQMELQDSEIATLKSDLKLAFKRIEEFQQALQGDLSDSDSDISDSDSDSDAGSLSSYLTASLRQHTRSSSNSTLRTPPSELQQERGEPAHSPTSEGAMSMISEDEEFNTKESFA